MYHINMKILIIILIARLNSQNIAGDLQIPRFWKEHELSDRTSLYEENFSLILKSIYYKIITFLIRYLVLLHLGKKDFLFK